MRPRTWRGWMLAAALTLLVAPSGRASAAASPAAATPAPPAASTARQQVEIRVTRRWVGRPIPPGFLGISMEFSSLYAYAGTNPAAPNPVFARLVEALAPGRHVVVRIGGDSTDRTWWPVPGMTTPPWAQYTLTPHWNAVARALAEAMHARLILGINLLANSPTIAAAEAHAFLRGIGRRRIAALEIGNEPELYSKQPWYRTANGQSVTGRPAGYDFQAYLQDVARIREALPPIALAGPATGALSWLSHLGALLASDPRLADATFHRYPLNRCVSNPASPLYPTVAHLLSLGSSQGLVRGLAPYVSLAHRHRARFRIDELNAVTCGGRPGVSNTFAAALWTLDTQFWLALAGVDGVEVHIHPEAPANQLFEFRRRAGRWTGSVRPQYYGLLMFSQAAPPGSHLLRVIGPAPGQLRAWATLGPDRRIRLVLINASLARATAVAVAAPGPAAPSTLVRLQAPSAHATGGVTLGGQTFGPETPTGRLRGRRRTRTIRAIHGRYRVELPAASAAMLTIPSA